MTNLSDFQNESDKFKNIFFINLFMTFKKRKRFFQKKNDFFIQFFRVWYLYHHHHCQYFYCFEQKGWQKNQWQKKKISHFFSCVTQQIIMFVMILSFFWIMWKLLMKLLCFLQNTMIIACLLIFNSSTLKQFLF